MIENRYEHAKGDVSKVFARPQDIVDAGDLSLEQKIDLLKNWERDLNQLLTASDESMIGTKPSEVGERLRSVRAMLTSLA